MNDEGLFAANALAASRFALKRRTLLAGATLAPLAACTPSGSSSPRGGWIGSGVERGHLLRERKSGALTPEVQRGAGAIVVGAGIAGLTAARALVKAGIEGVRVFELEDGPGGNSRGHVLGGMACPLGAHYLPLPSDSAVEVIEMLEDFGLRRTERGEVVYDERHLCHSPQERLFIAGHWREGLLPPLDALPAGERVVTLAHYRRFGDEVARVTRGGAFTLPTARSRWSAALDALDAVPFAAWLDEQGLTAPALRWYLDYCCRDDYGAGAAQVSAWAGLHYFASRHGFHAPGDDTDTGDAVLTWPEGNAWLARRLAQSLGDRLLCGRIALRVSEERHAVAVELWNVHDQCIERWTAPHLVMAVPLFISARVLAAPPQALSQLAGLMRYAPWLVGNLHLSEPLDDVPGAAPAWDNAYYESGPAGAMLGYVDAMHQSTRPYPGSTLLTSYWSLGGDSLAQLQAQRQRLLSEPWQAWAARIVEDLARAHPDLAAKLLQIDLMRYGHAMSVPCPGVRSSAALRALAQPQGRLHFAHADLSSYSVFEESAFQGARAAAAIVRLARTRDRA